ncbi:MAG TPA: DUF1552 domain-containing protein [Polyangiaceae bacterium]|jgi:hypothetical protein|nr:DUF1552 domain-containing protein [Polyangiaceae bacterium]
MSRPRPQPSRSERQKKALLGRRQLLGALGAVGVAVPLLSSLRAHAQSEQFPKRVVLMFTPNGVIQTAWWPATITSETDFELGAIHQPLVPYQDRLLVLHGVNAKVAMEGTMGGPHQRGIGGLFTGESLQAGEFVDGCGKTAGWANGISVDQAAANVIGQDTPLKSLELGVRALENDVQGRIAYSGPGEPLPPMNVPLDVYNRLISAPGFAAPAAAPADPLLAQRKSILDTVASEFDELEKRVSAEDKAKLEEHLGLVRDLERRMTATGSGTCAMPEQPQVLDPSSETDMPTIAELEVDLLAMAFACDLTRVASLQISTSLNRIRYPWLNSLGEGHTLSHSAPADNDAVSELITRGAWHAGLVARLCSRLEAIPEGDGTALDNTVLVWCSEVSEGNVHSHTNMPFLVLGGGWYFRTGRYLDFGGASHNGLLVSLLNALGVDTETFGKAGYCTGPLSGLT